MYYRGGNGNYLIKNDAAVYSSTLHQIFFATRVESDVVGDVVDFSCSVAMLDTHESEC